MEFSQHALDKCTLYGVNPELVRDGSRARVFEFLDRPWVAVLTPEARRAGGRWLFLNR